MKNHFQMTIGEYTFVSKNDDNVFAYWNDPSSYVRIDKVGDCLLNVTGFSIGSVPRYEAKGVTSFEDILPYLDAARAAIKEYEDGFIMDW